MKQYPKNLKYKKYHKVNFSYSKLLDKKNFFPINGEYGIQAMESGKLTFKQIEACRRTLRRGLKKKSLLWIKCFTSRPATQKPIASRMGKVKDLLVIDSAL